jgi:hypothetical protein
MQQTKQASAGIQTMHTQKGVQRPRTWNMQVSTSTELTKFQLIGWWGAWKNLPKSKLNALFNLMKMVKSVVFIPGATIITMNDVLMFRVELNLFCEICGTIKLAGKPFISFF